VHLKAFDEDVGGDCDEIGELTLLFKDIINGKYNESSWLKFNKAAGEILFSITAGIYVSTESKS